MNKTKKERNERDSYKHRNKSTIIYYLYVVSIWPYQKAPTLLGNICINLNTNQGTLAERGRPITVDLLIEVACFVTKVNNIFSLKAADVLVSTRR